MMKQIALLLLALPLLVTSHQASYEHILWDVHPEPMPFAVSDLSATYVESTNTIVLVGGCDSPNGNERAPWDNSTFYCPSVTDRTTIFDPTTGLFTQGPPAPAGERYRHAAVHDGQGRVWLLGGRDAEDSFVSQVDVFDTASGQWLDTAGLVIPQVYNTSDNGAFYADGRLFVVGGYDVEYSAVTSVFSIDPTASLEAGTLQYEAKQGLNEARGDVHAVTVVDSTGETYAIIAGGFTHEDNWCQPLFSTEQYHVATDRWTEIDNLSTARADKALVSLDNRVFAIGGEGNTDCSADPKQKTLPINDVEVLDLSAGAEWTLVEDIPNDRFRFTAASVPSQSAIFTFGGQQYYNPGCDCFKTSDLVIVYTDVVETVDGDDDQLSAGAIVGITLGAVFGSLLILFIVYKTMCKKQPSAPSSEMDVVKPAQVEGSTTEMDPDVLEGHRSAPLS